MTDFKDALRKGLSAHERLEKARADVEDVLSAASADVTAVLGASVVLRLETGIEDVRSPTAYEVVAGVSPPTREVERIVARDSAGRRANLATVEFGEVGYPLTLRWGSHAEYASDREGFEQGLATLLQSATSGQALSALVAAVKRAG